jgi:hypothetical protein
LDGAVVFTVQDSDVGFEVIAHNTNARQCTVSLFYNEGGVKGYSAGIVPGYEERGLEVAPSRNFEGTFEISAFWS